MNWGGGGGGGCIDNFLGLVGSPIFFGPFMGCVPFVYS